MSVAIFSEYNDQEQVYELLCYYQDRERCKDVELIEEEWYSTLEKLIENFDLLLTESVTDNEATGIINCMVSLVILMPPSDIQNKFIDILCKQIETKTETTDKRSRIKHNALNTLFMGVTSYDLKFKCFEALLNEEINNDKKHLTNLKLKEVTQWMKEWLVEGEDFQRTLRKLHRIFDERSDKISSNESMMMLLRSFTKENASLAREDSFQFIVNAIQDPAALTMDQILELEPVQCLKGQPIFDLLTIFVTGTMQDYSQFLEKYPNFMKESNLNKELCLNKMRVLSLMQLASAKDTTELDYSEIQQALELSSEELENFIIEAVRQRAIACKLDQANYKVLVAGAVPRQFGHEEWQSLGKDLELWCNNFEGILENLIRMRDASLSQ